MRERNLPQQGCVWSTPAQPAMIVGHVYALCVHRNLGTQTRVGPFHIISAQKMLRCCCTTAASLETFIYSCAHSLFKNICQRVCVLARERIWTPSGAWSHCSPFTSISLGFLVSHAHVLGMFIKPPGLGFKSCDWRMGSSSYSIVVSSAAGLALLCCRVAVLLLTFYSLASRFLSCPLYL